jgi:hypothetical protein
MPKASEVAAELRRVAGALEQEPEAELTQPSLTFFSWDQKAQFFNAVKLLPRPMDKESKDGYIKVKHEAPGLRFEASIRQEKVCTLVEPAKPAVYKCEPLLSPEEEEQIA